MARNDQDNSVQFCSANSQHKKLLYLQEYYEPTIIVEYLRVSILIPENIRLGWKWLGVANILVYNIVVSIGLYHPLDGIKNPKYTLLNFLTTIFCKGTSF